MKREKKPGREEFRVRGNLGQQLRIMGAAVIFGIVLFLPVIGRLWDLTVREYDRYAELARRNQSRTTAVTPERGIIYDRNMEILASNVSTENVYLNPRELRQAGEDLDKIAEELGRLLEKDPQKLRELAGDTRQRYKLAAAGIDAETAGRLRAYLLDADIRGIHLEPNTKRIYPKGSLACQVIGFTNASNEGAEGVEACYNSYLAGTPGRVITSRGNNEVDMPYPREEYAASQRGADVILTLDAGIQACLENRIREAMARYQVENGAFGIVMKVKTGEILAMATLGGYDPNHYLEIADGETAAALEQMKLEAMLLPPDSGEAAEKMSAYRQALQTARLAQWRNRVLSDGYEPGSTFKVLTMAAALDCGAIDLNTDFYCRGAEQIPGRSQLLHCWRSQGHGPEKTPQALQNSCNIAFAHIALKLGGQRFYDYVQKFGILEKTGIDLAGESKGVFFDKALVTDTDKWGTASLTSGSFGQTFKLTPLQLVRAISSVVNGGDLMEPYIVSEVVDSRGNALLKQEPTVVRRTVRPETSELMCRLLESVVVEGTAKNAAVAGFSVGGKTGTSEKIDVFDENGRRVLDKIVSFVGVAPMDDPEYIVLVALDTPSRSTGIYISGGVMAAPTVGAVLGDILPYLGVRQRFPPEDPRGMKFEVPDFEGLTKQEAQVLLKDTAVTVLWTGDAEMITGQIPAPGETVPGNGQLLLYLGQTSPEELVKVPDFTGMHRQQAERAAGALALFIKPAGNPELQPRVTAVAQSIPPGEMAKPGTVITVQFTDTGVRD